MNLDKLKDLEHRLTHLPVIDIDHDCISGKLFFVYENHKTYLTVNDVEDTCTLRNQAKEMISTIERYKVALEEISDDPTGNPTVLITLAEEALKEPEKALTK